MGILETFIVFLSVIKKWWNPWSNEVGSGLGFKVLPAMASEFRFKIHPAVHHILTFQDRFFVSEDCSFLSSISSWRTELEKVHLLCCLRCLCQFISERSLFHNVNSIIPIFEKPFSSLKMKSINSEVKLESRGSLMGKKISSLK